MRNAFWLMLLSVVAALWPEGASSSGDGSSVYEVRSGRDMAVAFASSASVDVALVLGDVWMREADWHGLLNESQPILLSKDFTILGSPSLPSWPLLNMGYVHGKIQIGNGVTLTVRHVVVSDFRSDLLTQAPGFDLAAPSPPGGPQGVLLHNETAVTYSVCLPRQFWSVGVERAPRATSRPGNQAFLMGLPQTGCLNLSANASAAGAAATLSRYPPRGGLALQPRLHERCWADRGVFRDMAVPGADLNNAAYGPPTSPNRYDVVLINVSYMCADIISPNCYPGLLACALKMTAAQSQNGTLKLPWQLPEGPAAEVVVRSGRGFAAALAAAPLVASVVVAQDIWMVASDWEGLLGGPYGSEPATISRDLVVQGALELDSRPLLNLGFVHDKIRIASGVTLTASRMLIGDFRNEILTQGPGFDLAAPTKRNAYDTQQALLVHIETTLLYALCFPAPTWNNSILSTPRAKSRPGNQTFSLGLPQHGCVDATAAGSTAAGSAAASSSSSSGLLQPPLMSRCWPDRGLFIDVALYGADVDPYGKQMLTGYDIVLVNVSYICANAMSEQCVSERGGVLGCMTWLTQKQLSAAEALPWRHPPPLPPPAAAVAAAPASGGPGGDSREEKAAAIGGAVGGAAVLVALAAAAALFVRRRHRRRQRSAQGDADGAQFSNTPKHKLATSPGGGAQPQLPAGSTGADPDPWRSGSTGCLPVLFQSHLERAAGTSRKAPPARAATDVATTSDSVAVGDGGVSASGSGIGTGVEEASREGGGGGGPAAAAAAAGGALVSRGPSEGAAGAPSADGGPYSGRVERSEGAGTHPSGSAGPNVPPSSSDGPTADPLTRSCGDSSGVNSQQRPPRPQASTAALQPEDEHMVVTPLTPQRADLAVGEAAAAEVSLLPVVRGKGAFGRVYEGMYGGLRVAVKVMRDVGDLGAGGGGSLEHVRSSFAQEVEVLGRCQHPNVVRLLAACLTPPKMLLVMELMETSLEKLVYNKEAGLMPLRTVLYIALDVAKGLEYLHPTILHRDLKPGNVLVNGANTPRPIAKLTDFGVSRLRSTVLVTKHPEAGTPAYMAPETFDVKNYTLTHHVDIYSFGVLLWVLLTGEHPWRGFQMVEVAYKVTINRERLPTARIPPSRCPARLRALIEQCWEYEPRRRPAAAEVVKELQVLLDGMPQ